MTTLYRTILVAGLLATASLADMDPRRMQRDIRIMEGVLGNLYLDAPDPTESSSRGLYLDSYGVLFLTEGSWPRQAHPGISVSWDEKGVKFLELKSSDPASDEKSLAEIHDLLAEFLGNYAGIIGQLDSDDRITVCYQRHASDLANVLGHDITDDFTFGVQTETDSLSFDLTKQIEAIMPIREGAFDFEKFVLTFGDSVSFFDTDKQVVAITRLRKHLEELPTEGELEVKGIVVGVRDSLLADVAEADAPSPGSIVARIHGLTPRHRRTTAAASLITTITATAKKSAIDAFRAGRIDSAAFRQRITFSEHADSKKIDIMAGILDQVSGQEHHPLIGGQRTLGMYQPELGVLFLISDSVFRFRPLSLDDVKANIIEAVADYGATLSQVQPDEHIIVEYRTGRTTHLLQGHEPEIVKYHPDQVYLLQIPKSTIDAYARGDLDLDAFSKKAVWKTGE